MNNGFNYKYLNQQLKVVKYWYTRTYMFAFYFQIYCYFFNSKFKGNSDNKHKIWWLYV